MESGTEKYRVVVVKCRDVVKYLKYKVEASVPKLCLHHVCNCVRKKITEDTTPLLMGRECECINVQFNLAECFAG